MAAFASPLCGQLLEREAELGDELGPARAELVERLFPLVEGAPAEIRRFLLAVKRDAFNGRTIGRHASRPEWWAHLGEALAAAERVREIEQQLAAAGATFDAAFAAEQAREHAALTPHLSDRRFLRAIALGSPLAATQLRNLPARFPQEAGAPEFGRREKRQQASLLRYLSRAAFKLSPFSSFTPVALATTAGGAEDGGLAWLAADFRETALVRVQPAFLDQVAALLLEQPVFRRRLEVQINPTLEEIEPGIVRWYRPGHWSFDAEKSAMRYQPDAFLKLGLKDRLLVALAADRGAHYPCIEALAASLVERLDDIAADAVEARLDKLRRLGFLLLPLPWPSNGRKLEAEMARVLGASADGGLRRLGDLLAGLVAGEEELAAAADPVAAIADLDHRVDVIWQLAVELAGPAPAIPYVRIKDGQFFDDVLRQPASGQVPGQVPGACHGEDPGAAGQPLLQVPGAFLSAQLDAAEPLLHLANAADSRFDFLLQLNDLLAASRPDSGELGIFEAFELAKPLFRDFSAYEKDPGEAASFDPRNLPAAGELAALRRALRAAGMAAVESSGGISRLDPRQLAAAVELIPAAYRCEVGPCLFLQPADSEGRRWVANRIYEGTGRYSSRFGALLEDGAYARFAAGFLEGSGDGSAGRPFLLDLIQAQGDTLNVHRQLTARMLWHPGDQVAAAPDAAVRLEDLRVRLFPPGGLPQLVDRAGRRYLPVHLGGAARRFLPTLFRFLSYFGPSELTPHLPRPALRACGQATVRERLELGDLVLMRQRWIFAKQDLPAELFAASDAAAYRAIDGWRKRHGMPEKVFLIENVHHPTRQDVYKPQYLDLSSPLFVTLLRAALKTHQGVVSFEEMLPEPAAAPRDPSGAGWLVELLVERQSCR